MGRQLIAAAEEVLGPGTVQHGLVDRGYLDGDGLTTLHQHGTWVTIGVREDRVMLEDRVNLSRLPILECQAAAPPKLHADPQPQREIMSLPAMEAEGATCDVALSACLICDTYPDKVGSQGLVTTQPEIPAADILQDNGQRWTLEKVLMMLTRYWDFAELPPCRLGVAYAMTHFALLAYTLLGFYLQETDAAAEITTWNRLPTTPPPPERELAVYAGPYFTLLLPSELLTLIREHVEAWQANREQLLMALRLAEGNT